MKQFLVSIVLILISGCVFGPIKELKYQIEDSWKSDPQKKTTD